MRRAFRSLGVRAREQWFEGCRASVRLPDGQRLELTHPDENFLTFSLHWRGWTYYEPVTTSLFIELFRDKRTFYDIGANVGYFSLIGGLANPRLNIVSFEPNPKLHRILASNIAANGLSIEAEAVALSDRVGEQSFYLTNSDMSGSLVPGFRKQLDEVKVASTTVDAHAEDHPPEAEMLMKVDVEGHEANVIRGAAGTLERFRPDVVLEVIEPLSKEIAGIFRELGYRPYRVDADGLRLTEAIVHGDEKAYSNFLLSHRPAGELEDLNRRLRRRIAVLPVSALREASCY